MLLPFNFVNKIYNVYCLLGAKQSDSYANFTIYFNKPQLLTKATARFVFKCSKWLEDLLN
jgi:hypothetical protein